MLLFGIMFIEKTFTDKWISFDIHWDLVELSEFFAVPPYIFDKFRWRHFTVFEDPWTRLCCSIRFYDTCAIVWNRFECLLCFVCPSRLEDHARKEVGDNVWRHLFGDAYLQWYFLSKQVQRKKELASSKYFENTPDWYSSLKHCFDGVGFLKDSSSLKSWRYFQCCSSKQRLWAVIHVIGIAWRTQFFEYMAWRRLVTSSDSLCHRNRKHWSGKCREELMRGKRSLLTDLPRFVWSIRIYDWVSSDVFLLESFNQTPI